VSREADKLREKGTTQKKLEAGREGAWQNSKCNFGVVEVTYKPTWIENMESELKMIH
jgi:hypothetical protein